MSGPVIDLSVAIRAPRAAVWRALTDPDLTERYWGGTRIESEWRVGAFVRYWRAGELTDEHVVLAIEPGVSFTTTFRPLFGEFAREPGSRAAIALEERAGETLVRVRHDAFPPGSRVHLACSEGWPRILAGLKSLLESE